AASAAAAAAAASASSSSSSSSAVMRNLSAQDLSSQLATMGMADSADNQQLAMKMLEYGLELSPENFEQLFGALQSKGNNQSAQQAAFTALAKGVAGSQSAVNALDQFFSGQMSAAQQVENLTQQLSSVAKGLAQAPNALSPALNASLSSLLTEFDTRIKQMNNKDNLLSKENIALSPSQKDQLSKLLNDVSGTQQSALNSALAKNAPLSKSQQETLQQMLSGSVGMTEEQTKAMQDLLLSKNVLPANMKTSIAQMLQKDSSLDTPNREAATQLFSSAPKLNVEQRQSLLQVMDSGSISQEQKMLLGDILNSNYSNNNLKALDKMVAEAPLKMDQKLALNNVLHSLASPKTDISISNASNMLPNMTEESMNLMSQLVSANGGLPPEQLNSLMSVLSSLGLMNGAHVNSLEGLISGGGLPASQSDVLKMLLQQPGLLTSSDISILQGILDDGQLTQEQLFSLQQMLMQLQNKPMQMPMNMAQDLNALQSFIKGIYKQLSNQQLDEGGKNLVASLKSLEKSLMESISNMTAQGILSKMSKYNDPSLPDKYFYWMIPNPFTDKKNDIEILVKRDTTKDGSPVNPQRTQIILKTETESMGAVAVIVEISDKDIWYLFNTDNDDARQYIAANSAMLRDQMKVLDYNVQGFQTQIKKVNINKILSPTLDLDRLRRINAEA
ncbi:MAG: hypothetical protein WCH76_07350, partial [Candidatus Riflemargulisbacteria bacterium]